jgi:hypothetical protein
MSPALFCFDTPVAVDLRERRRVELKGLGSRRLSGLCWRLMWTQWLTLPTQIERMLLPKSGVVGHE